MFTPSAPLAIAASTFPSCQLEFDVQIVGRSNDSTPNAAEEVAGYEASARRGAIDRTFPRR